MLIFANNAVSKLEDRRAREQHDRNLNRKTISISAGSNPRKLTITSSRGPRKQREQTLFKVGPFSYILLSYDPAIEDMVRLPRAMAHGTLALPGKSLASLAKILPLSYQDLAKDTMIMQDRAKRTMFYHDLGNDAKINHVLDKHSMVANPSLG